MRLDKKEKYNRSELLLYTLSLGPAFTSLILYYGFLLAPHRDNSFYCSIVLFVYFVIAIFGMNQFKLIFIDIKKEIKKLFISKGTLLKQIENFFLIFIIVGPIFVFLVVFLIKILPHPILGKDILDYGITGRMLYEEKSLEPIWIKTYSSRGYIYKILHSPSFSLLLSWEELINNIFDVKNDFYFKSISAYYGFLILCVQFFWVTKRNKWVGLYATIVLVSGLGFFLIFIQRSIDSYRIFFILISWIFLAYVIKKKDFLSLLMFGIFTGLTAFSHRIGLVIFVINITAFFFFFDSKLSHKIERSFMLLILGLAFGGSHYIFDILLGQGAWLQSK
jgi:hypothetical protein